MRKACFFAVLCLGAVAVAASIFGSTDAPCLLVESEQIRVSDLVPVLPALGAAAPESIVGPAPVPGARRGFTRDEIARLLGRFGLPAEQSQPLCVEYKTQGISSGQIREALLEAWQSSRQPLLIDGQGVPEIEVIDWSRQPVPPGKLEFPASVLAAARPHPRDGMVFCRGVMRFGERRSVPVWARARIFVTRPAVIAQVALPAGHSILPTQLRMEMVRQYAFAPAGINSIQAAAGAAPRRTIRAGEALAASLLVAPALVGAGENVTLRVLRGQASVRLEARALTAGRLGERILVRNPTNGGRLKAVVEGKGLAVVIPGG